MTFKFSHLMSVKREPILVKIIYLAQNGSH